MPGVLASVLPFADLFVVTGRSKIGGKEKRTFPFWPGCHQPVKGQDGTLDKGKGQAVSLILQRALCHGENHAEVAGKARK